MATQLIGEALEARIKELEAERDKLIAETPYEWYGPKKTSHGKIRLKYNKRIGCLRKYGFEYAQQSKVISDKITTTIEMRYGYRGVNMQKAVATKQKRYGNGMGDMQKFVERRLAKFGHMFGDKARCAATHRQHYGDSWTNIAKMHETKLQRYGNKLGDMQTILAKREKEHGTRGIINIDKALETKQKRYGNKFGNIAVAVATKRQKYGSAAGDLQKIASTNMQRYGVPYFCMTAKCRDAQGHVKSRANHWWHDKLLQELGIDCGLDDVNLERWSYDLNYSNEHCKLLIEINPTWSHNSTYGFAYLIGRTTHNKHVSKFYHFDKTQLALKLGYTCITIFEWMDDNEVIDVIRKHLAGEPVDSTNFALNPQLSDDKSTIRKHWCHLKTKEHIEDCGQNEQEMIDAGYVAVYDCGHAILQRKQLSNI